MGFNDWPIIIFLDRCPGDRGENIPCKKKRKKKKEIETRVLAVCLVSALVGRDISDVTSLADREIESVAN